MPLRQGSKARKQSLQDPSITKLIEFKKLAYLETAVFLLHFREEHRPDFEKWKKENPTGIQAFLEAFALRP